jgi:hypothetical protein
MSIVPAKLVERHVDKGTFTAALMARAIASTSAGERSVWRIDFASDVVPACHARHPP